MRCTASRKDRLQTAAMAAGSYRSNRASAPNFSPIAGSPLISPTALQSAKSSAVVTYFFLLEKPCRQTGAPKHRRQRYVMLLQPLCPKFGYLKLIAHDLSEAMSIEKRYFTSDLSNRS